MQIADAQREVRSVFIGGSVGPAVASGLWLLSAALSIWGSPRLGIVLLVVGGGFIFPVAQLILRAMGRRASLSSENPMNQLALQVALTIPLNLPVVGGATLYRLDWFYPACMIVVGTHYLPFVFLYGMWQFGVLGAVLIGVGLGIGLYGPGTFSLGGWVTAAVLLVFAFILRSAARREERLAV